MRSYLENPRANLRLPPIATYYINWINAGTLPKPLYDMDIHTMHILFQIQGDVTAAIDDQQRAAMKNIAGK